MNINYDFELILTCKRYNLSDAQLINKLREVWAARCEIKLIEVRNYLIADSLISIASDIYIKYKLPRLGPINVIELLSPVYDSQYVDQYDERLGYWERVLIIYASALAQTEIRYFDGLNTYFENIWKKAGKP